MTPGNSSKAVGVLALLGLMSVCCSSTERAASPPEDTGDAGDAALTEAGPDGDTPEVSQPDADAQPDAGPEAGGVAQVILLHTADERGRLLPETDAGIVYGGAANVMGWWTDVEHASPDTHLILSGGDSWTGPPTSTWSKGQAVVEVFNRMGYDVATLGPRDFDFGRDILEQRIAEADFPFVAANLHYTDTNTQVDFALPYVIVPVNGVQVAVLGLHQNPHDINPLQMTDITLADYVTTIDEMSGAARAEGAEVVVVLSSAPIFQIVAATEALSLPVDVVFAGRAQAASASELVGLVPVLATPHRWLGYHRVVIDIDLDAHQVIQRAVEFVEVKYAVTDGNPVQADPEVEALVDDWEQQSAAVLGEEIGYCEAGPMIGPWATANWLTDAWLWAHPEARIAIQNSGGIQASLDSGPVTIADFYELFPFENYIFEVKMTGAQVRTGLLGMVADCASAGCFVPVGGIRYDVSKPDLAITFEDGTPLDPSAEYPVLINSYVYGGGAGFPFDPSLPATPTNEHMRDPVIAWTRQLGTTAADPLDDHLDPQPRDTGYVP